MVSKSLERDRELVKKNACSLAWKWPRNLRPYYYMGSEVAVESVKWVNKMNDPVTQWPSVKKWLDFTIHFVLCYLTRLEIYLRNLKSEANIIYSLQRSHNQLIVFLWRYLPPISSVVKYSLCPREWARSIALMCWNAKICCSHWWNYWVTSMPVFFSVSAKLFYTRVDNISLPLILTWSITARRSTC